MTTNFKVGQHNLEIPKFFKISLMLIMSPQERETGSQITPSLVNLITEGHQTLISITNTLHSSKSPEILFLFQTHFGFCFRYWLMLFVTNTGWLNVSLSLSNICSSKTCSLFISWAPLNHRCAHPMLQSQRGCHRVHPALLFSTPNEHCRSHWCT